MTTSARPQVAHLVLKEVMPGIRPWVARGILTRGILTTGTSAAGILARGIRASGIRASGILARGTAAELKRALLGPPRYDLRLADHPQNAESPDLGDVVGNPEALDGFVGKDRIGDR